MWFIPPMSGSTLLGLRRGSGCWWWLPSPMPRWEFFPVGFRCCPLRSFPCALVLQGLPPWGVVFRGIPGGLLFFAHYPLGQILIVRCSIPFPVLGGGERERERKLLSIIMLSCNPNDRLDHILIDSFHLWIITVTVGRMLTCGLDGLADLVYVGLGV